MLNKIGAQIEFGDFLNVFLKGIFKDVVGSVVEIVKEFRRAEHEPPTLSTMNS